MITSRVLPHTLAQIYFRPCGQTFFHSRSSSVAKVALRSFSSVSPEQGILSLTFSHKSDKSGSNSQANYYYVQSLAALLTATGLITFSNLQFPNSNSNLYPSITKCDAQRRITNGLLGTGVGVIGPTTKEPQTKIIFPHLCNGMTFCGCGVRVKYMFVKVYAVGTYMDPIAMAAVKSRGDDEIEKALLDPMYPRTIRIVMNRTLTMEKYLAAICDALEPRMGGRDLDKLEEFKKMNPPGDMVEGSEIQMTIRGDTLLYQNSAGAISAIHSDTFCRAMCDVYYGKDPASPDHKTSVVQGIKKL